VFSLSPDAVWLLCSRRLDGGINTLAAVPTAGMAASPVALPVTNIVHFADWSPVEPRTIAYSTVQPVATAPGWQANNDLRIISFDEKGTPSKESVMLGPQSAGSYSWWGSGFAWSPDGARLAYARPDEIGWINRKDGIRHILLAITPFRTLADWVWLPPAAFTPDGAFLLTVRHGEPVGLELPEASPAFDLAAIPVSGGQPIILAERTGMFASPIAGPKIKNGGGQGYNVAFLQALRPLESDRSTYRLMVADRDGSNLRALFPPEGEPGLDPQQIRWSPDAGQIAAIYKGNLWVVDLATGTGQQITSDGQVTAVDWK
jgi:hypothetical protein